MSRDSLITGKSSSCQKCAQLPNKQNSKYYVPIGSHFGFLTTVSEVYSKSSKRSGHGYIKCKCSCGNCSG